jgi:hypothetical protein
MGVLRRVQEGVVRHHLFKPGSAPFVNYVKFLFRTAIIRFGAAESTAFHNIADAGHLRWFKFLTIHGAPSHKTFSFFQFRYSSTVAPKLSGQTCRRAAVYTLPATPLRPLGD